MGKIKEQEEAQTFEEVIDRKHLNIQQFMTDMSMVGMQVNSKELAKPTFNYGDLSVTNYLLWLLLGEVMILNDKISEEE